MTENPQRAESPHRAENSRLPESPQRPDVSRRGLLITAGVAATTGIAGWSAAKFFGRAEAMVQAPGIPGDTGASGDMGSHAGLEGGSSAEAQASPAALPRAERRPGITHPAIPQRHALITVFDVSGTPEAILSRARAILAAPAQSPADAGIVSITLGFGVDLARALWPTRSTADMSIPTFAGDTADLVGGGALALQVCAETQAEVHSVTAEVLAAFGTVSVRWSRTGSRDAPTPHGTTRTPVGFVDGIINPRTVPTLTDGVWTDSRHRDTYLVMRRMHISPDFQALDTAAQEAAIGRRRSDGAPLSGGGPLAEVDLFAKTADGRVLTPQGSHVRRAHPANLGRPLMLRRSYAFETAAGQGMLFIAFLNDPQTFVSTQRRLDERDDFLAFTTADAVGAFFVPGDLGE